MKYMKRAQVYKSNNCFFAPKEMVATSYNWWHVIKRVGTVIVYNDYRYSNSTNKHQSNVLKVMRELGIRVDLIVKTRSSLKDSQAVEVGVRSICYDIAELKIKQKYGNKSRMGQISRLEDEIQSLLKLQSLNSDYVKVPKKFIKEFVKEGSLQAETRRTNRLALEKRKKEENVDYIRNKNLKDLKKQLNKELQNDS